MPTSTLELTTPHGTCPTQIFTPDGAGPWPAVIVCFDALGVRQSLSDLSARIARGGYVVALPDFFYRVGSPYALFPEGSPRDFKSMMAVFSDPEKRAQFFSRFYGPTIAYDHLRDTVGPLLEALAKRPDVRAGVGTTGYCMGGNMSVRLATIFGDKIAATAAFHPGGLVTAEPDSPHLRLGSVKSRVYVAAASDDQSFTEEAKAQFVAALEAAHVQHTVETYPARHGFAVADHPTFDAAAAERHYTALEAFFASTLGQG
jgi:carboxymethylenebutenolidase